MRGEFDAQPTRINNVSSGIQGADLIITYSATNEKIILGPQGQRTQFPDIIILTYSGLGTHIVYCEY